MSRRRSLARKSPRLVSQRRMLLESLETRCLLAAIDDFYSVSNGSVLTAVSPGVLANDTLGEISVSQVNGSSSNVGSPISLASGATLTVNGNGGFSYDPTTSPTLSTITPNTPTNDSFTYTTTSATAVLAQWTFPTLSGAGVETGPGFIATSAAEGTSASIVADTSGTIAIGIEDPSTSYATQPVLRVNTTGNAADINQAVANNKYFTFTVTPNPGNALNLNSLTFNAARGGASTPRGWGLRTSADNFATTVASQDVGTIRPNFTGYTVDLSGSAYQGLTQPITFRMYVYAPSGGTIEFDDITVNGSLTSSATATIAVTSQVYVDDAWTAFSTGQAIVDADPVTLGDQPAVFGVTAFSSPNAAMAAIGVGGRVTVNAGTYNEAVNINKALTMRLQEGAVSFSSLDDSTTDATLELNGVTLTVGANNTSTRFDSIVVGTGGLTKVGSGTLTLAGANTFAGTTNVNAGGIAVAHNQALGTTAGETNVANNAWVRLTNGITVSGETITIAGTGELFFGALQASQNSTATWAGPVKLGSAARIGARTGGQLTISGAIQDDLPANTRELVISGELGTGTVVLSGANTYKGRTDIVRGVVRMGATNSLPSTTVVDVHFAGTDPAQLNLNGFSQSIAGLRSTTLPATVTSASAATLTVNQSTSLTYSGVISGSISLVKSGTGVLTLSGANTYTGTTTINAGSLIVTGGIVSPVIINADTLSVIDSQIAAVKSGANLVVTVSGATAFSGPLAALPSLTVNGQTGNDTLTVDYGTGGSFSTPIAFHGGNQSSAPGDTLAIVGGVFDTVTYHYTNANDGAILFDVDGSGGSAAHAISYTGLEPISNSGTATNAIFNLPATDDLATLSGLGGGLLRLSGSTFETTDFAVPTGSLTINAGVGNDTLHIGGAVSLPGDLKVFAENVTQSASLSVAGMATFQNALSYAQSILNDDPYLYLQFNETSGTTVASTTNGLTGTILGTGGSVVFDHPGPITSDVVNRAIEFSPASATSGRHIDFTTLIPSTITGDGAYAFEFWFNPDTNAATRTIYAETHGTTTTHASFLETASLNRIRAVDRAPAGSPSQEISPSSLTYTVGQWQHVVMQVSGGKVQLYINGVLDSVSPNATAAWGTAGRLVLARLSATQSERYFDGRLDEFALYDEPLTSAQINARVAFGNAPIALPLNISLDNAGNDFHTVVYENANSVTLRDANDLRIQESEAVGAVNITAGGRVNFVDEQFAGSLTVNAGSSLVNADITTSAGAINFSGPVLTTTNVSIDSAAANGNITFNDAVQATNVAQASLMIDAGTGNVSFNGPVGGGVGVIHESANNVFVIEAENYTSRVGFGTTDNWLVVPTESAGVGVSATNARGGRWVQSLPDNEAGGGGQNAPPYIDYQINVTDPGTYRLYMRWDGNVAKAGNADSVYAGIVELQDGVGGANPDWYLFAHSADGDFSTTPWDSNGGREQTGGGVSPGTQPNFNITAPGVYTVRIWQREDGAAVDSFILQKNTLAAPTGFGPQDSGRLGTLTINSATAITFGGELQAVNYQQNAGNSTFSDGAYLTGNFFVDRGNANITGDLYARSLRVASQDVNNLAATSNLVLSGGRVIIGDGSAGTVFDVGRRGVTRTNTSNILGSVNFANATSVAINVENARLGSVVGSASIARGLVTLSNVGSNSLRADTLLIGDSNVPGATSLTSVLTFGSQANTLNADDIYVGRKKANGTLNIAAGGTLTVGGKTSANANLFVGYNDTNGTAAVSDGKFNLSGGTLNANLNQVVLGLHNSGASPGAGEGTFTMDAGTVNAVSVVLGDASNQNSTTSFSTAPAGTIGTLQINGGTFNVSNIIDNDPINNTQEDPTGARPATAVIEVDGGVLNVTGSVLTDTVTIDSGSLTVGSDLDATLIQINGGALNVAGSVASTTVNVDNGTMAVGNGLNAPVVRVGFSNGTPANVSASLMVTGGAVSIGNGATGNTFLVGRSTGASNTNAIGIADFSGASSTTINVASMLIGTLTGNPGGGDTSGTLLLSDSGTNTINANTIMVSDSPGAGHTGPTPSIRFGGATNNLNVNTLTVAGRKSKGALTILPGGTLNLDGNTVAAANVFVADNNNDTGASGVGTIDMTGGVFNATINQLILGRRGTSGGGTGGAAGTLTMDAGTVTASSVTMGVNRAQANGTINLNGGTLIVNGTIQNGTGPGTINLAGGTLQFVTLTKGAGALNVNFSSGTIQNVAGQDLTVTGGSINLLASPQPTMAVDAGRTATIESSALVTGAGGLTKTGAGTLVLEGANSYADVTTINAGTLLISNASGSATGTGDVAVQANGTLGGNGSIDGNVAVSGTLSPGLTPGALGVIAITGNLSLLAGSTYAIDATALGSDLTTADNIVIDATANLAANIVAGLAGGTTLTVLDAAASASGQFAGTPNTTYPADRVLTIGSEIYHLTNGDPYGRFANVNANEVALVRNSGVTAFGNAYTMLQNSVLTGNVKSDNPADSDPDGDATVAFVAGTEPSLAQGVLTLDPTGAFSFTPAVNFKGTVTFKYTLTDGENQSAEAMVTINVTNVALDEEGNLTVGGSTGDDRIIIQAATGGKVAVRFNNLLSSSFLIDASNKVLVYGNSGNDTITVSGAILVPVEIYGGAGNDYLSGSARNDILDGGEGNDRLFGNGGHDELYGGAGSDSLSGGAGHDYLSGDEFIDLSLGRPGVFEMSASPGRDTLNGDAGNDILWGGDDHDILNGGADHDQLYAGEGNDKLDGGSGNDLLAGEAGADKLYGRAGRDTLVGGDDLDTIYGGTGMDLIYGGDVDLATLFTIWENWSTGVSADANQAFTDLDDFANDDGLVDLLHGEGDIDWYLNYSDRFLLSSEARLPNRVENR